MIEGHRSNSGVSRPHDKRPSRNSALFQARASAAVAIALHLYVGEHPTVTGSANASTFISESNCAASNGSIRWTSPVRHDCDEGRPTPPRDTRYLGNDDILNRSRGQPSFTCVARSAERVDQPGGADRNGKGSIPSRFYLAVNVGQPAIRLPYRSMACSRSSVDRSTAFSATAFCHASSSSSITTSERFPSLIRRPT